MNFKKKEEKTHPAVRIEPGTLGCVPMELLGYLRKMLYL